MLRFWLAIAALAGLLLVAAGCGGSDEPSSDGAAATTTATGDEESEEEESEEEESATPAEAVAEIGEVRELLDDALADYRAGERADAEETVGDAYLEHFEHVEGPLEERDRELMEELEQLISATIRSRMKDGAPAGEVERLVAEAKAKLDEAERLLESG
jgi:hypothetical protein